MLSCLLGDLLLYNGKHLNESRFWRVLAESGGRNGFDSTLGGELFPDIANDCTSTVVALLNAGGAVPFLSPTLMPSDLEGQLLMSMSDKGSMVSSFAVKGK
jgi:hypothetical protein